MGITKLGNQNLSSNSIGSGEVDSGAVDTSKISATITNEDISPSANISATKVALPGPPSQFVRGDGSFGAIDTTGIDENAFNIGVLGFKMAVNDGLTIFNLKDGVVDEFNDESGTDSAENTNTAYDSTSDFYTNQGTNIPIPSPEIGRTSITSLGSGTYSVEPGITTVNVLVVGGGGGGGSAGYNGTDGGGAGAGGLIYYPDYPVTPGGSVSVSVGAGGEGAGYNPPSPGSAPYTPTARPDSRNGTGEFGGYEHPQYSYPMGHTYYSPGQTGTDTSFGPLIGEGGGAGGGWLTSGSHPYMGGVSSETYHEGGSGGAGGGGPTSYYGNSGEGKQATNHPIPLTPTVLPVNSPGSFGNNGGLIQPDVPSDSATGGGGGAGGVGGDAEGAVGGEGGIGLNYNIADGSTSVGYAGGGAGVDNESFPQGTSVPFGGGDTNQTNHQQPNWFPGLPGAVNSGGGGAGARNINLSSPAGGGYGGDGGPGIIIVAESKRNVSNTSMTLVSDTFTASSTPTKARIVVFAELPDGLSDFTISATRDNTTFNAITLTDEGYEAGSSGIKIFTGSTPLTGSASPQVQLRWKIVGSSLSGANKIHGVSLQWE
tara:strand:- start:2548 stop:4341 length:1794 start_codon:yes stop_codon:yes gene_type:complete